MSLYASLKGALDSSVSAVTTAGCYSAKGAKFVVGGAGNVVLGTTKLFFKTVAYVTVPSNVTLGTVSSLAGTAAGGALFNWGPVIMAQGIINASVAAGAQWGIPAGLCKLGAFFYISAVGVPNLPASVIAAGGFAATCAVIGIGNAVIDLAAWGKSDQAKETLSQLQEKGKDFAKEAKRAKLLAEMAEKEFHQSYILANQKLMLVEDYKQALAKESDLDAKKSLEDKLNNVSKEADLVARQASLNQTKYLELSLKAKEAMGMVDAAKFALSQVRAAGVLSMDEESDDDFVVLSTSQDELVHEVVKMTIDPLQDPDMVDMLALVDEWKNAIEVEGNPDLKRVLEETLRLYFNGDNEQTVDTARCAFSEILSSANHSPAAEVY